MNIPKTTKNPKLQHWRTKITKANHDYIDEKGYKYDEADDPNDDNQN